MKRKSLIKSCLLGATLLLGSGYAVINNRVLTATGIVPIAEKDIDVKILDIVGEFSSPAVISPDGYSVSFALNLIDATSGSRAFEIRLENNEDVFPLRIDFEYEILNEKGENIVSPTCCELALLNIRDANTRQDFEGDISPNQDVLLDMQFTGNYAELMQYSELTINFTLTVIPVLD